MTGTSVRVCPVRQSVESIRPTVWYLSGRALAHVDRGDVVVPAFFENPVVLGGGVHIQIGEPVGRADVGALARPKVGRVSGHPVACPPRGPNGEVAAAIRTMAIEHGACLQLGTVGEGKQRGGGIAGGRRDGGRRQREHQPGACQCLHQPLRPASSRLRSEQNLRCGYSS
jgi:hypothetical protein